MYSQQENKLANRFPVFSVLLLKVFFKSLMIPCYHIHINWLLQDAIWKIYYHLHILSERLSYLEKEMSLENYRIFANMIVGQFTLYNPSNRLWKSVIQINGDILTGTIWSVTLSI